MPGVSDTGFHGHLDRCAQCRNNPFALCTEGYDLLRAMYRAQPTVYRPPVAPPPPSFRKGEALDLVNRNTGEVERARVLSIAGRSLVCVRADGRRITVGEDHGLWLPRRIP